VTKLLLVEDDREIAGMVNAWLASQRYDVDTAYDGDTGLEYLLINEYDVVILDWELPGKTGVEIIKAFRDKKGLTPIIMLTAKGAVAEKEIGLDAGADDYLAKPFSLAELSARIRALLRRAPVLQTNILTVADLTLDPKKYRVTKNGNELRLNPRDFALLEFFMRHPDEIFSTDSILQRVWQSESDVSNDTLRTSIKRLRQQIDGDREDSMIENIPKIGYRLKTE
jgi:DNA-binding response OmpR family regulator